MKAVTSILKVEVIELSFSFLKEKIFLNDE